jgi:peroxisome-assembly ATPase
MASSRAISASVNSQTPWTRNLRTQWRSVLHSGSLPKIWTRSPAFAAARSTSNQTIAYTIARRLVLHHWLLVFDEIQLLDVSSAGLLADVLSWFWRMGGVIVGTSNKVPDDLYKHGLQRERLEPFVEALKVRCPVMEMREKTDWRRVRGSNSSGSSWFKKGDEKAFADTLAAAIPVEAGECSRCSSLFCLSLRGFTSARRSRAKNSVRFWAAVACAVVSR